MIKKCAMSKRRGFSKRFHNEARSGHGGTSFQFSRVPEEKRDVNERRGARGERQKENRQRVALTKCRPACGWTFISRVRQLFWRWKLRKWCFRGSRTRWVGWNSEKTGDGRDESTGAEKKNRTKRWKNSETDINAKLEENTGKQTFVCITG